MPESAHTQGVNWATYKQVKLEIRNEIFNDIQKYSDMCRERGMNGHFTSGLDLAADIALNGARPVEVEPSPDEVLF